MLSDFYVDLEGDLCLEFTDHREQQRISIIYGVSSIRKKILDEEDAWKMAFELEGWIDPLTELSKKGFDSNDWVDFLFLKGHS